MTTSEKVAKILLSINAITLSPKKPYRFVSGVFSPVYTDCRILMSYPKERRQIRDLYIQAIEEIAIKPDLIAATATAGIPHGAWVAEKMNLPMIYVRGSAKDHGKGNQIEGVLRKGQKVVVIEDLISTGESSVATANVVNAAGGKAKHIFSIITYGMKKSDQNFKSNKLKHLALTTFKDVVQAAEKLGVIKKDEVKTVLEWANDPPSWGKNNGFEK